MVYKNNPIEELISWIFFRVTDDNESRDEISKNK